MFSSYYAVLPQRCFASTETHSRVLAQPMASWNLPGRNNDPVMRYKAILDTYFAFSRTLNPRNIECPWYPLWTQTLSDLVAGIPNVIVAPQYAIWFMPVDVDPEDENDGDDPEEIQSPPQDEGRGVSEVPSEDDDQGNGASDISFASTIAEKHPEGVIVDFAILKLTAVTQPQPESKSRYGGWRITATSVGLLVEVEWFASRSRTGQTLKAAILEKIMEARAELNKHSVLGIAAAGPCWYSAMIRRANVKEKIIRTLSTVDPSYQPPSQQPDLTFSRSGMQFFELISYSLQTDYKQYTKF